MTQTRDYRNGAFYARNRKRRYASACMEVLRKKNNLKFTGELLCKKFARVVKENPRDSRGVGKGLTGEIEIKNSDCVE